MATRSSSRAACAGWTLLELTLVLAIAATLVALATPSFQAMLAKQQVLQAAHTLLSDLRFTRTEAIKRSRPVQMCKSSNGLSCSDTTDDGWAKGWLVMAGTEVLRVQGPLEGLQSSSGLVELSFQANGLRQGQAHSIIFQARGAPELVQRVCISLQGRARLAPFGATAC